MISVAPFFCSLLLCAALSTNDALRKAFDFSFLLLLTFLAIRYKYGNDYVAYEMLFEEINQQAYINYSGRQFRHEAGWVFLSRAFGPLGFQFLVAALSAFHCAVFYWFVKKYVLVKYYWVAMFILLFDARVILTQLSAMRQAVAVSLLLLAFPHLYQRNAVRYFCFVGFAVLFHQSALVAVPLFLIALVNSRFGFERPALFLGLYLALLVFIENLQPFALALLGETIGHETYSEVGDSGSLFGRLYYGAFLTLLVLQARNLSKADSALLQVTAVLTLLCALSAYSSGLGRLEVYAASFSVAAFPVALASIRAVPFRAVVAVVFVIVTLYRFNAFFENEAHEVFFGEYRTIFSVVTW